MPGEASAGPQDAFVRGYDAAGTEVWTRQFGTANADHASSVSVAGGGSLVVAGRTDGILPGQASGGGNDAFVMKLAEP